MKPIWLAALGTLFLSLLGVEAEEPDAIWEGILANPPTVPHTQARNEALAALDEWLMNPNSELSELVIAYYQQAVDRALDTLENERISEGIRMFQLYSSSVIVQTPETVFAFDLDQGPRRSMTPSAAEEGGGFRMTPEQIARIAALVEVSFHTHEHSDHVDYELTQALCAADKTVVVTKSNKELWQEAPWADKLTVLDQTIARPHTLGALKVDVLWDHQWSDEEHTRGTPCNAYLITTPGGIGILNKGDINCGLRLYGWLHVMVAEGRHVDLFVGSPIYWRGVNLARHIDALLSPVWALGHVWEFGHRSLGKSGGATGTYTANLMMFIPQIQHGEAVVLSWGEYLDLPTWQSR